MVVKINREHAVRTCDFRNDPVNVLTASISQYPHRTKLIIGYLIFKEYYATLKIVPLGGEENGKIKTGLRNWVDHSQKHSSSSSSSPRGENGKRDPKPEVSDTTETVLAIPFSPTTGSTSSERIGQQQFESTKNDLVAWLTKHKVAELGKGGYFYPVTNSLVNELNSEKVMIRGIELGVLRDTFGRSSHHPEKLLPQGNVTEGVHVVSLDPENNANSVGDPQLFFITNEGFDQKLETRSLDKQDGRKSSQYVMIPSSKRHIRQTLTFDSSKPQLTIESPRRRGLPDLALARIFSSNDVSNERPKAGIAATPANRRGTESEFLRKDQRKEKSISLKRGFDMIDNHLAVDVNENENHAQDQKRNHVYAPTNNGNNITKSDKYNNNDNQELAVINSLHDGYDLGDRRLINAIKGIEKNYLRHLLISSQYPQDI